MKGSACLNSQYKKGVLELCVLSLLKKRGVADCGDILEEYEQHFVFKLADGYSEEEIAAKLGSPKDLAAQFDPASQKKSGVGRFFTIFGLCWLNLFYGIFAVLLASWAVVMASAVLSFGLLGVCLVGNLGVTSVCNASRNAVSFRAPAWHFVSWPRGSVRGRLCILFCIPAPILQGICPVPQECAVCLPR